MIDLVDPLGSHIRLPFWSRDHVLDIILQDQLTFLDHGILPFFLFCRFFIAGRFLVNDVAQQGYIVEYGLGLFLSLCIPSRASYLSTSRIVSRTHVGLLL